MIVVAVAIDLFCCSCPLKMMNNGFRELTKFVQMMCADLIDDIPVY